MRRQVLVVRLSTCPSMRDMSPVGTSCSGSRLANAWRRGRGALWSRGALMPAPRARLMSMLVRLAVAPNASRGATWRTSGRGHVAAFGRPSRR